MLTYLRMQGQKEIEDDFEQRWSSLKPNPTARQTTVSHSSFPILEQFDDGREPDEMLTVTETSHGLSFEYVWEAAKHDHYDSHNRSSMETTLNYHSMFFPVPQQDIQARFPDTKVESDSGRIPGMLPVFDAREGNSRNEYYIQLEGHDRGKLGAEGATASDQEQYVVLQDVRLDESSTEADFFHQSIDSKDSFVQDSHIWSSSDHESPYQADIFSENDLKPDQVHSFSQGLMELPEIRSNQSHSFSGDSEETPVRDSETLGAMTFLNSDKLVDNYLFLSDNRLMKGNQNSLQSDMQEADSSLNPFDLDATNPFSFTVDPSKSEVTSAQLRDEFLDLVSPILKDFLSPLNEGKALVPSDVFSTEVTHSGRLPEMNGSFNKDSSKGWISSTSKSSKVTVTCQEPNITHQLNDKSATMDVLPSKASLNELEDSLTSLENGQHLGIDSSEQLSLPVDSGITEGLTSSDSITDILSEAELSRKIDDHSLQDDLDQPETFFDNHLPDIISDPCLDQISQDSLLDDSVDKSATPDTPESLDFQDMHQDSGTDKSQSPLIARKLQAPDKPADSGYETENVESPEWNFQPGLEETRNPEESPVMSQAPPEIVVSDADLVPPDVQENGGHQHPEVGEAPTGGSYRDSAYFSDNEELDKKSDDVNGGTPTDVSAWDKSSSIGDLLPDVNEPAQLESILKTGLGTSIEGDWDKLKPVSVNQSVCQADLPDLTPSRPQEPTTSTSPTQSVDTVVHAKLVRTYAGEGPKKKEPDMEGRYLGKLDGAAVTGASEDGAEADEEDENSDDSDEDMSAYRLHSSGSESEDDEVHPVPVIVTDSNDNCNLKSLLKPKSLQIAKSTSGEDTRKTEDRRSVSFFDDVTVYLFDQVSQYLS